MDKLEALVQVLEQKIPKAGVINPSVSKGSVGWHVHHCLLMINVISNALSNSDPEEYKWKPNLLRTVVLNAGFFPRGKVKAPRVVEPTAQVNGQGIEQELLLARINLVVLRSLPRNAYFKHMIFGNLNLHPARTFLRVHTKHHLKIINDILK